MSAPSLSMVPSETSGCCTPNPMNDSAVSDCTVATTPRVNETISSEPMFGIRWRSTIRSEPDAHEPGRLDVLPLPQ